MICLIALVAVIAFGYKPIMNHFNENTSTAVEKTVKFQPVGPKFNPDSAYAFTAKQCDFGPRPMNTPAHEACGKWIVAKFKQYGCKVSLQQTNLKGYDGTMLKSTNIMAQYNPETTTRVLICAHWDSRPWADNDPDSANWRKPILAANDAASGVAVMMEIARQLQQDKKLNIGVDFVCLDAEDWGTPQWANVPDDANSWALGAQYFAANLPKGYKPRYGILLDMVGGQAAQFYKEGYSMRFAPEIVKKVWQAARQSGYENYFQNGDGGYITDDHLPINQFANIPTIDIIPYYPDCPQSSFGPTWHTIADNMDAIDKQTLQAVGQTIIQTLYTEK